MLRARQVRLVLVGLVVGDEQLAVPAVAQGLLSRHAHDVQVALRAVDLVEDAIWKLNKRGF